VPEGIRIPVPPGADLVQPYPVHLPQFDGPLDLLLHLVRKDQLDLRDLPVAEVCRQYHAYIVLMTELDLEVAGEFLYVEALLLQIKSQMVLPRRDAAEGEPGEDPRDELVRRLLEYRRYKAAAEQLHVVEIERLGLWSRPTVAPGPAAPEDEEVDLSEVSLFDLLSFFRGTLDRYRAAHPPAMEITHQRFSIKGKMEEMLSLVPGSGVSAPLSEIFRGLSGRAEAIATFLALLELLRLLIVRCQQTEEFAEIYLERTGENASLENYEEAYR